MRCTFDRYTTYSLSHTISADSTAECASGGQIGQPVSSKAQRSRAPVSWGGGDLLSRGGATAGTEPGKKKKKRLKRLTAVPYPVTTRRLGRDRPLNPSGLPFPQSNVCCPCVPPPTYPFLSLTSSRWCSRCRTRLPWPRYPTGRRARTRRVPTARLR